MVRGRRVLGGCSRFMGRRVATEEVAAMNADDYARDFQASLHEHSQADPRHQQMLNGHPGASDFSCRQELAYIIGREPVSNPEHLFNWAAFVGSALDDRLQMVRAANRPHLKFKQKVPVTLRLPNGEDYTFTASPDEIDPVNHEVTDFKSKDGLAEVRKNLNDDDNRRQIHLQYYAMTQAHGWPTDGVVRNMFVDRSGSDPNPVVVQEPFDPNVVAEAAERLWDSLYAVRNNERAHQDRYRSFCEACCPWVGTCRGGEVQGEDTPIFDKRQHALIEAYFEASMTEKAGKALREELKPHLDGLVGKTSDGLYSIKTTISNKVNGAAKTITVKKLVHPEQKEA